MLNRLFLKCFYLFFIGFEFIWSCRLSQPKGHLEKIWHSGVWTQWRSGIHWHLKAWPGILDPASWKASLGSIIAWNKIYTAGYPSNWIECDGRQIPDGSLCYKLIQIFRVTCFIAGQYNTDLLRHITSII